MTLTELKKMRDRAPFLPFTLHLSNGEVLPVGHAEQLQIYSPVDDVFTCWVGREWNLVEVKSVLRISHQRPERKTKA